MPLHRSSRCWAVACLLGALLIPALPATGTQAESVEHFIGTWRMQMVVGDQTFRSTLTFEMGDDDVLKGTWKTPRMTVALEDIVYARGKLTFKRPLRGGRGGGGQSNRGLTALEHEATIVRDQMVGVVKTPRGEREFTATRQKS